MSLQDLLDVVPSDSGERSLLRCIDFGRLPRHVAVIMDGNGRWANLRHKRRVEGHRAGIAPCGTWWRPRRGWGCRSSRCTPSRWRTGSGRRPSSTLMALLERYLRRELDTLLRNNIRFQVIGRIAELPRDVQEELARAMERTRELRGLLFNIALNYGGRTEITDAVRRLVADVQRRPRRRDRRGTLSSYLYTAGQPDPDLLIRTSGSCA